jgi:hypothetical protein
MSGVGNEGKQERQGKPRGKKRRFHSFFHRFRILAGPTLSMQDKYTSGMATS